MCEIYYMHSQDAGNGLDKEQMDQLLKSALDGSLTNPHGWGIFDDMGRMMKSEEAFDSEAKDKILNRFGNAKFIILHLRHATHGSTNYSNTHPFTAGNYLMVHNGVLDINPQGDRTDSELLLHKIISKGHRSIGDKIGATMDNNAGSVSCFLYNSNVRELYYWRKGSSFEFAYDPESKMLFGATRSIRLKNALGKSKLNYFNTLPDRIMTQTPSANRILKIDNEIHLATTFSQPSRFSKNSIVGDKKNWKTKNRKKDRKQGKKHVENLDYDPDTYPYISPYSKGCNQ